MDDETTRAGDPLAAEPMGSSTEPDSSFATDTPDVGVSTTAGSTNGAEDAATMPATTEVAAESPMDEVATEPSTADVTAGSATADVAEAPSTEDAPPAPVMADTAVEPSTEDVPAAPALAEAAAEPSTEDVPAAPALAEAAAEPSTEDAPAAPALADAAPEPPSDETAPEPAAATEGEAEAPAPEVVQRSGGGGRGGRSNQQQGNRGSYGGSGSDMAALLAESEQQFRQLKYGDVLEGRVMRKDHDEILVDIGSKSEGVIPMSELSSLTADELQKLDIGDEVLVSVMQPENQEGHVVLSLDKARQERSWRNLQKKFENGEILEAEVTGYNKGGLLVNLEGVRGFVPASQVSGLSSGGNDAVKQSELSRYTGQRLPLKIIEINRNRNRLILSERQAAQEQRDIRKERLLSELQPGQIRPGTVSSICDFGAFVDIGGADGLIHLSELSWSRVNHPSEVLKVGQPVQVFVMSVDERDRKIALSLKRTQPEPWSTVMDRYHLGQLVRGTITQLTDFGAFARLEDGIEGLIHVSELAEGRVTHPRNVVQEGWNLTLRVIRIDPQRRRMGLSLKRAMEVQEGDTMEPQGPLPIIPGRVAPPAESGAPVAAEGETPRERPFTPPPSSAPPRQDRPMGGGGSAPRQDRGGGGSRDRDRGRRGDENEPRAQMPAQPQLETAMAAAMAAAMGSASDADVPERSSASRSETSAQPAQADSGEANSAPHAYSEQETTAEGSEPAPTDMQAVVADATGAADEAAAAPAPAYTDVQADMAEAAGPAQDAAADGAPAYADVQADMAEATGPAQDAAADGAPAYADVQADMAEATGPAQDAASEDTADAAQPGPDATETPASDDDGSDAENAT